MTSKLGIFLLVSGECCSKEGFVPELSPRHSVLIFWSMQIRRSELGRQPAFKTRAGDSRGWGNVGTKTKDRRKFRQLIKSKA